LEKLLRGNKEENKRGSMTKEGGGATALGERWEEGENKVHPSSPEKSYTEAMESPLEEGGRVSKKRKKAYKVTC
jgi:hypothetical protein